MNTQGAVIDLSPVLVPLLQFVGGVLSLLAVAAVPAVSKWAINKLHLQNQDIVVGNKAYIDGEAQKGLAGALSRAEAVIVANVPMNVTVKNQVIADAATRLIANAGPQLQKLGDPNIAAKASEIIENRIGLMQAAANGTPVPNPSAPVAAQPIVAVAAPLPAV